MTTATANRARPVRVLQMCAVDFTVRQFLAPLARALEEAGYEVSIACTRGTYFEGLQRDGFRMIENPVARSLNVVSHIASLIRTWRLLRRGRYDVLHVHTPIAALIGRVAARCAGVPLKIYTAHGFYFHDGMRPAGRAFHVALERLGALCGDYLLTVSREDEETALRLRIARPGRVRTVWNGVDLARFRPGRYSPAERESHRAAAGFAHQHLVIGIVGRLVREKGLLELAEAAARLAHRHPDLRILVVGGALESDYDAFQQELDAVLARHGIRDRFAFTGLVTDTAPWLAAMDIFTLPTYREGMPVSILEAMASGLPVVATDIRGCREEIVPGETGLLVPARAAGPLADALEHLIVSSELRAKYGAAGRRRAEEHFDERAILAAQVRLYDELVREHNLPRG